MSWLSRIFSAPKSVHSVDWRVVDPSVYLPVHPINLATEQDEWAKISYGNKRRLRADDHIGNIKRVGVIAAEELENYVVTFPDGDRIIVKKMGGAHIGDYYLDGGPYRFWPKENFEYCFHSDFSHKNVNEHWNEDCLVVKQPATRRASEEVRRLGMLYDHGKPNNFAREPYL